MWQSPDPILGSYVGGKPNSGVYGSPNLALYTYTYQNPIILRDPSGKAPRNLGWWSRFSYKAKILNLKENVTTINRAHTCAGTTMYMAEESWKAVLQKKYRKTFTPDKKGNYRILASRFFSGKGITKFYKPSGKMTYKNSGGLDKSYRSKNVEIGTIGVFKRTEKDKRARSNISFTGHIITVTGVEDRDNGIRRINYIEGHQDEGSYGNSKPANTGWVDIGANGKVLEKSENWSPFDSQDTLDFVGWGEYQPKADKRKSKDYNK